MTRDQIDLYGGISGAELPIERFDFGHGVTVSKTYAHLMAPFMMAFARPEPGMHHPEPWKAASGGFGFDVVAELHIPASLDIPDWFDGLNTVWWFTALLRFRASHPLIVPVVSDVSFSQASKVEGDVHFWPIEIEPRRRQLTVEPSILLESDLSWIRDHWLAAGHLMQQSREFNYLFQAIDQCLFEGKPSLALLALWGAIEAMFSPARSELRFRVSANMAAYLEKPGPSRHALQKKIAKLYDARSAVAHGSPDYPPGSLDETYHIVKRVLLKIINCNRVPDREELERDLFG